MTTAIATIILTFLCSLMDLLKVLLNRATPGQVERILEIAIANLEWAQRNVWTPLGKWLESLKLEEPPA